MATATSQATATASRGVNPPKGDTPQAQARARDISPRLRAREAIQAGQIIRVLYLALAQGIDVDELPQIVESAITSNHNADQIFGELLLVFSKLPDGERVPAMRLAKEVFG